MASTDQGKIYSYGKGSKAARNGLRERFARAAKKSAGQEPDEVSELVALAVKLFSKAYLVRVAGSLGFSEAGVLTKTDIVKECLRRGWSPESEEQAIVLWNEERESKVEMEDEDHQQDDQGKIEEKLKEFKMPVTKVKWARKSEARVSDDESDFPGGTDALEGHPSTGDKSKAQLEVFNSNGSSRVSVPAKGIKRKLSAPEKGYGGGRDLKNAIPHGNQVEKVLPILEEALHCLKASLNAEGSISNHSSSASVSMPGGFPNADSSQARKSNRGITRSDPEDGCGLGVDDVDFKDVSTHSELRPGDNSLLSVFNSISDTVKQQASISRALVEAQQRDFFDKGLEPGCLPPSVTKKAKKGQYISVLEALDVEMMKLRLESKGFPVKFFKRPNSVDGIDMDDFCLAMSKIGSLYSDHGQNNLCIQLLNLLGSVYKLTATHQRLSVMKAVERLRSMTTRPDVVWSFDSIYAGDFRSLLRPLSFSNFTKKTSFSRQPRTFTDGPEPDVKERSQPAKASGSPKYQCAYWAEGRTCPYGQNCKFQHTCSACRNVSVHDPGSCKLRSIRNFGGQPKPGWPKRRV